MFVFPTPSNNMGPVAFEGVPINDENKMEMEVNIPGGPTVMGPAGSVSEMDVESVENSAALANREEERKQEEDDYRNRNYMSSSWGGDEEKEEV